MSNFPKDFKWGTATASYQVEGAHDEDGRVESIWDVFSHTSGKTFEGHTGDKACGHYHKYKEDVQLMADLGIQSYRFSIAWPRIFSGPGQVNPKGLDFYKRLLEELHHHHIKPVATMYHWDLPQWLQEKGGWGNRDTVEHFVEYAGTLFSELDDQIPMWITHNEPWCAAFLGHGLGVHAPGHKDWHEALTVAHHLLLSHGKAVNVYRQSNGEGDIGITLNLAPIQPATEKHVDLEAAERADGFSNRWFLDPVFKGDYPADMKKWFSQKTGELDFIQDNDMEIISAPNDFLGVNYYDHHVVECDPSEPFLQTKHMPVEGKKTEMGWGIHPGSLYGLLTRLQKDYTDLPLYVTENGAAFPDEVVDGEINDRDRIEYLESHFDSALRFVEDGGHLKGYYVWSLMDNFEWAFGYSKRFGLVYVDYPTQNRIPKASARWYKKFIARQMPVS